MTLSASQTEPDVIVIGGGLNGATLAIALAQSGFSVTVLDAQPQATATAPAFDGRASAIAAASRRLFAAIGVWPHLAPYAQEIRDIVVTDGDLKRGPGPFFLRFDHGDGAADPLGHMAENRHIRMALFARLSELPAIDYRGGVRASSLERTDGAAIVTLQSGARLRGRVAVACDGRRSAIAQAAGVRYVGWDYGQSGLVCSVAHEAPHGGVAHEYFLPAGPFAILPLKENRSSLVWTEKPAFAAAAMRMGDEAFLSEVRRRFGDFLGPVTLAGPRFSWPLEFSLADEYALPRLAILGDAAHGVHPIAGQGFNLGLRDVAALTEVLEDAALRGEDIGALDVLRRYGRMRRFDNTAMALGFDAINRIFSNDSGPLRALRGLALAAADRLDPLRRRLTQAAAGDEGALPRLMRET